MCYPILPLDLSKVVKSFQLLYDGVALDASSSSSSSPQLLKMVVTELRGDWKYLVEACIENHKKFYCNAHQKTQLYMVVSGLPNFGLTSPLDQEMLQLSRWYKCNYICHRCWAHKDSFMVSPAKLLDRRRCSTDDFFSSCIKPGQRCP